MTFFGTFLTRSGVVSSVHSFAESPIGPNYLAYLAALMLISITIYGIRAPSILPSESEKSWGVSRESALIVTQFLLISFAAIVLIGTLFPIVSEWLTKQRITVQAPYFNMFAPWVGLGVIFGVAIGNLLRYGSNAMPNGKKIVFSSIVFAIPCTIILVYFGDVMSTVKMKNLIAQLVGLYLTTWAIGCLIGDLYYRLDTLKWNFKLFITRSAGYFGGWIAHLGILIAIIGFLGNYRGMEHRETVKAGQSFEYYGYKFEFKDSGIEARTKLNATAYTAPVNLSRDGTFIMEMDPAQAVYPTKPDQTFNEIAITGNIWHDVYLVLVDFDKTDGKRATFQLNINPTVRFVWFAIVIICIGGLIALTDKYRGNKSRDVIGGEWETSK